MKDFSPALQVVGRQRKCQATRCVGRIENHPFAVLLQPRASTRSGEESPVARGVEAATLRSSIYATASGSALVRFASKPARRYKARLLSPPARDSRTRSAGSLANRRAISYIAAAALNVTIAPKSAGFAHKFRSCGAPSRPPDDRRPPTRLRKLGRRSIKPPTDDSIEKAACFSAPSRGAPGVSSSRGEPGVSSSRGEPGVSSSRGEPGVSSSPGEPGVSSSRGAPGVSSSRGAPGVEPSQGASGEPSRRSWGGPC